MEVGLTAQRVAPASFVGLISGAISYFGVYLWICIPLLGRLIGLPYYICCLVGRSTPLLFSHGLGQGWTVADAVAVIILAIAISNGIVALVANFAEEDFTYRETVIPGRSILARWLDSGRTQMFTPLRLSK